MIDYTQRYLTHANQRLGTHFEASQATTLTSIDQDGNILAIAIFSRFTKAQCELTVLVESPKGITREFIKRCFGYAFLQCDLRRITGFIAASNVESLDRAQRLGFKIEGTVRHWFPDSDALILGLLRDDAMSTWFKELHGRRLSPASS